jgi:hypothetical protein
VYYLLPHLILSRGASEIAARTSIIQHILANTLCLKCHVSPDTEGSTVKLHSFCIPHEQAIGALVQSQLRPDHIVGTTIDASMHSETVWFQLFITCNGVQV